MEPISKAFQNNQLNSGTEFRTTLNAFCEIPAARQEFDEDLVQTRSVFRKPCRLTIDLAVIVRASLADKSYGRWEDLTDELLQDGLLVRSANAFEFAHLSFQEFLTAKALVGDPKQRIDSILRNFLDGDNWWKQVVCFYIGLAAQPTTVVEWIDSAMGQGERSGREVSKNAL